MNSFRITTCFLLAVPLVASAGSYSPTVEKKHLITKNQTAVSDVFNKNLEKIRNPSIASMISQTGDINLVTSEHPVAVSDVRETFTKNLERIHNPSVAYMISETGGIKHVVSGNPVAISEAREAFTKNLEKIRNPSIDNATSQAEDIKYVVSEIQ